MEETDRSVQGKADRRPERIPTKLPCFVLVKGRIVRRVVIDNLSKAGLRLTGEEGLYLNVRVGDKVLVHTEFDGVKMRLEGVVVRSTIGAEQSIALGNVNWYEGWTPATSEPAESPSALSGSAEPLGVSSPAEPPSP
jgi:hypothetical protein